MLPGHASSEIFKLLGKVIPFSSYRLKKVSLYRKKQQSTLRFLICSQAKTCNHDAKCNGSCYHELSWRRLASYEFLMSDFGNIFAKDFYDLKWVALVAGEKRATVFSYLPPFFPFSSFVYWYFWALHTYIVSAKLPLTYKLGPELGFREAINHHYSGIKSNVLRVISVALWRQMYRKWENEWTRNSKSKAPGPLSPSLSRTDRTIFKRAHFFLVLFWIDQLSLTEINSCVCINNNPRGNIFCFIVITVKCTCTFVFPEWFVLQLTFPRKFNWVKI